MFLTIAIMRRARTPRIGIWLLCFTWHNHYLLLPMKKAHGYYFHELYNFILIENQHVIEIGICILNRIFSHRRQINNIRYLLNDF